MKSMNDIEVIINNKRYTLSGYESQEYLQRIASYINGKYDEFTTKDCYNKCDNAMRNILLEINVADDYFKAINKVKEMEDDNKHRSNDVFDMKHEVIATQTKLETTKKELDELKEEYQEAQKKIVKLETELADMKK